MTGAAALGKLVVKDLNPRYCHWRIWRTGMPHCRPTTCRLAHTCGHQFGGRLSALYTGYRELRWPALAVIFGRLLRGLMAPEYRFDSALLLKSYGFTAAILYGLAIMVARMLKRANGDFWLMRRRWPRLRSHNLFFVASDPGAQRAIHILSVLSSATPLAHCGVRPRPAGPNANRASWKYQRQGGGDQTDSFRVLRRRPLLIQDPERHEHRHS